MSDLALRWDPDRFAADLVLEGGALATDDGLRSAILISLFSDARAPDAAELPEPGGDRRGWWGDAVAPDTGSALVARDDPRNFIGALLWLLGRSKVTQAVIQRARQHAAEALDWILRDGIASAIDVAVEAQPPAPGEAAQRLAIGVTLTRPGGPDRQRFDFVWEASA